ncbi:unnamed protein product, partial [Amoebophrya sp. A120]
MTKIQDNLGKVQKALGDYLEKQRIQFARFYFIGDEDLLEIIGNSRDVTVLGHHLAKMFAGVAQFGTENEGDSITVMRSRENEEVKFEKPVVISEDPSIHVWLTKVETAIRTALSARLSTAWPALASIDPSSDQEFTAWVDQQPCQLMLIASQIVWTIRVESFLKAGKTTESVASDCIHTLDVLAKKVLEPNISRNFLTKLAQLITEMVHQRDVSRELAAKRINKADNFDWLQLLRVYWDANATRDMSTACRVEMTNASLNYGFEYLGMAEKLCQTPLTDRCFLTMTQALHMKMGGNPFGPAGTGKTESVKALGAQMGYFVLVFCCDETFDFQSMGRIFVGLCQVGAWGCFDEFNRLEE